MDCEFLPGNTDFSQPGLRSSLTFWEQSRLLLLDLEFVPGQTARPAVPERVSHAHMLTSAQRPGRRWTLIALRGLCPHSVALNVPSTYVPVRLSGLQFCPCTNALLFLGVVFRGGRWKGGV